MGGIGGLSYAFIASSLGITFLGGERIIYRYFVVMSFILLFFSVLLISRRRFSDQDSWMLAGIAMEGAFFIGLLLGIILVLPFGLINQRFIVIGIGVGIGIGLFYGSKKAHSYLGIKLEEIYSPVGAGYVFCGLRG